jgi:vacuolar-type H+-ATPase subunit E/Vma4
VDAVKASAAALAPAAAPGADADAAAAADARAARLKALKRAYKAAFDEMKGVQSDADYTATLVEACTRELVAAFDAWCDDGCLFCCDALFLSSLLLILLCVSQV